MAKRRRSSNKGILPALMRVGVAGAGVGLGVAAGGLLPAALRRIQAVGGALAGKGPWVQFGYNAGIGLLAGAIPTAMFARKSAAAGYAAGALIGVGVVGTAAVLSFPAAGEFIAKLRGTSPIAGGHRGNRAGYGGAPAELAAARVAKEMGQLTGQHTAPVMGGIGQVIPPALAGGVGQVIPPSLVAGGHAPFRRRRMPATLFSGMQHG